MTKRSTTHKFPKWLIALTVFMYANAYMALQNAAFACNCTEGIQYFSSGIITILFGAVAVGGYCIYITNPLK